MRVSTVYDIPAEFFQVGVPIHIKCTSCGVRGTLTEAREWQSEVIGWTWAISHEDPMQRNASQRGSWHGWKITGPPSARELIAEMIEEETCR